jgi:hypothetical protein
MIVRYQRDRKMVREQSSSSSIPSTEIPSWLLFLWVLFCRRFSPSIDHHYRLVLLRSILPKGFCILFVIITTTQYS